MKCCPGCAIINLSLFGVADEDSDSGSIFSEEVSLGDLEVWFPELEILRYHRSGGMGRVFLARQRLLGRKVALKILKADIATDLVVQERFHREATAMAELKHPGIVTIFDFGSREDCHFLLMEYVQGQNLGELLEQGPIDIEIALSLVSQIALAVEFAHTRGIIHRDLKPGNIMVTNDFTVKITDFGLSKSIGGASDASLTQSGVGLGTPYYVAPEQMIDAQRSDARADIYSLGVLFYQILTGQFPQGRAGGVTKKYPFCFLLETSIRAALDEEPEGRPKSAITFHDAAERCKQIKGRSILGDRAFKAIAIFFVLVLIGFGVYVGLHPPDWGHSGRETVPYAELKDRIEKSKEYFCIADPELGLPVGAVKYWNPELPRDKQIFDAKDLTFSLDKSVPLYRSLFAYQVNGKLINMHHPQRLKVMRKVTAALSLDVKGRLEIEKEAFRFRNGIPQSRVLDLQGGAGVNYVLVKGGKVKVAAIDQVRARCDELFDRIESFEDVIEIDSWAANGILLQSSGEIFCWNVKQGTAISNEPDISSGWLDVSCGFGHFGGIDDQGRVFTWLTNLEESRSDVLKTQAIPESVQGQAVRIESDPAISVVQLKNGTWRAWGEDGGSGLIRKIESIGVSRDIVFRTYPISQTELYWIVSE
ncbi:MAG: serine/threonine-protein kinase [Verrucomicrobiales bacterium]|nr:serine/threonine-protein kinase [Verrucomicrobiales bacterium]